MRVKSGDGTRAVCLGSFDTQEEAERAVGGQGESSESGVCGVPEPSTPSQEEPEPEEPELEPEAPEPESWVLAACEGGLCRLLAEPWECRCILSPACDGEACEPPLADVAEHVGLMPACQV